MLGDVRTRPNWSASNTSFVERDSEAKLRGFDDRTTVIRIADGAGGSSSAVLARLPRSRFRSCVIATSPITRTSRRSCRRPRDVRLTIDARLQSRVAAILAQYAGKSSTGRAAAVVLDPATGDVLASVSYPWPADSPVSSSTGGDAARGLCSIARATASIRRDRRSSC